MATISISTTAGTATVTISDANMLRVITALQATRYPDLGPGQAAHQAIVDWVGDLKTLTFAYENSLNVPTPIPTS